MIESIRIQNFQSHEDTQLEFVRGINAIVGESDSGKSAALRALLNVIDNRYAEVDNASWWVRKKVDGVYAGFAPRGQYSIAVTKNGRTCTRVRSGSENGYRLTGHSDLIAIGKQLPPEVQSFFNLTDTNIHTQHEPMFLISRGGSEVARYFNRVIRMEKIDIQLSKANSLKLAAMADVRSKKVDIEALEARVAALSPLDGAKVAAEVMRAAVQQLAAIRRRVDGLTSDLELYAVTNRRYRDIGACVVGLADMAGSLDADAKRALEIHRKVARSASGIESAKAANVTIRATAGVSECREALIQLGATIDRSLNISVRIGAIGGEIRQYRTMYPRLAIRIPDATEVAKATERLAIMQTRIRDGYRTITHWGQNHGRASMALPLDLVDQTNAQIMRNGGVGLKSSRITAQLAEYNDSQEAIKSADARIALLRESIPQTCPTCGQAMKRSP